MPKKEAVMALEATPELEAELWRKWVDGYPVKPTTSSDFGHPFGCSGRELVRGSLKLDEEAGLWGFGVKCSTSDEQYVWVDAEFVSQAHDWAKGWQLTEGALNREAQALIEAEPRLRSGVPGDLQINITAPPQQAAGAVARRITGDGASSFVGHHLAQQQAPVWVVYWVQSCRCHADGEKIPTVERIFATELEALRYGMSTDGGRRVKQVAMGADIEKELAE